MTSAAQLLSEQDHRDTWSLTIGKDMSDEDIEFVREAGAKLRELSQRYRAALREMVVRFEILDQDLNLRKDPKPNGYRSLHVIVRIPVYFLDSKQMVPVEIQLRTVAMDFWASLEHDLKYKAKREIEGIDSYGELKDCSRIIEDVEARMQILARALDSE